MVSVYCCLVDNDWIVRFFPPVGLLRKRRLGHMATVSRSVNTAPVYGLQLRSFAIKGLITLFASFLLFVYLLPLGDMLSTSLRDQQQLSQGQNSSIFPMKAKMMSYRGQDLPLYNVPTESGVKEMGLFKKGTKSSQFVDPAN